jgi:hypothetical protein
MKGGVMSHFMVFAIVLTLGLTSQQSGSTEAVAVVSALSGTASRTTPPETEKENLRLFDWLPEGCVIQLDEGSRLTLAFADGSRFELDEKTEATIAADGPKVIIGTSTPLESVPPMPRLAAISRGQDPGARSAAIRLRGRRIRGLYPRAGTVTLAENTVLSFEPVGNARQYKVELENESGRTIFEVETESSSLKVPSGILRPGARYFWSVRTIEMIGTSVRGQSEFSTLSAEVVQERSALRESLVKEADADSLALLAEVDRRLGLIAEARDGFKAALDKSPTNEGIRRALEEIEKQLSTETEEQSLDQGGQRTQMRLSSAQAPEFRW